MYVRFYKHRASQQVISSLENHVQDNEVYLYKGSFRIIQYMLVLILTLSALLLQITIH